MSEILKSDVFKHKDDKEILTYIEIHYYCMTIGGLSMRTIKIT